RRQPTLQHPAQSGTHESGHEELTNPRMTQELSSGQNQTLGWGINRHVRRLLNDVETFEMDPHGMSWVGNFAVRESVGRQQVTEFVVILRLGNTQNWEERDANHDD